MPMKKSELYSSLWESCDELRGGMDASQYKDYVLVLLFVKYVSDKYAGQKDALFDVPAGGRFADMVALKGDKEIGDKINKIIGKLAEDNDLKGERGVAAGAVPCQLAATGQRFMFETAMLGRSACRPSKIRRDRHRLLRRSRLNRKRVCGHSAKPGAFACDEEKSFRQ